MIKNKNRLWLSVSAIIVVLIGLSVSLPFSRFYLGKCLKVNMCVKVNNEYAIPENITCTNAIGKPKKVRIVKKENEVVVYVEAFEHGMNSIAYDVNTPEGVKHFTYDIMKTQQWGPRVDFWYKNELQQNEENEWYANVWLERKNVEAGATTIKLSEDENAHVHVQW